MGQDGDWIVFEASGRNTNLAPSGDLYISSLGTEGWSEPSNLSELNTAGSDLAAESSRDGKWLYFVSSGRNGPGQTYILRVNSELLRRYNPARSRLAEHT